MTVNAKEKCRIWLALLAAGVFLLLLKNGQLALSAVRWVYRLISPFLIGLCIAFVLNVFLRGFEKKAEHIFHLSNKKWWKKTGRIVSVTLLYLIAGGILVLLFYLVIPEIQKSIALLASQLPAYLQQLGSWLEEQSLYLSEWTQQIVNIEFSWKQTLQQAAEKAQSIAPGVFTVTLEMAADLFRGAFNLLLAVVFSVYMLVRKEDLCRSLRRTLHAFLSQKRAEFICDIGKLSGIIFSRFVTGQLTEAFILGGLCFCGMAIFSIPYAALISCIVGVTALIPIFGAFIGAGIGAFLLLVIEPQTALWFLIFIILLQQFEGNVIYPKIVGESIGLPAIWVLFAVMAGGSLFGIAGMLIGIPLASVLYGLMRQVVEERLRKKKQTDIGEA